MTTPTKYVIVEQQRMSGRYVALRGLSFATAAEAQAHINSEFRPSYASRLRIEQRAVKADDTALRMTCQCCAKKYLANLGTVAHHGYQRPGQGWQTASCGGAKCLPFEVSRERLGEVIVSLKRQREEMRNSRAEVDAEVVAINRTIEDASAPKVWSHRRHRDVFPDLVLGLTRGNIEDLRAKYSTQFLRNGIHSFDDVKARELGHRDHQINGISEYITESETRFAGWVQTHEWNEPTKSWRAL